jgi:hypothetical protein
MRWPMAVAGCAAGCQIFPAYYPAEVVPFVAGGDHSAAGDTGADTGSGTDTGVDTGALTTPAGATVAHYPTGAPQGPLPCADGDPYTSSYVTWQNPGGWAYDVVARAADCSEAVVYSSAATEVQIALPTGGAYVVRSAGSTWVSVLLPPTVVYLTVGIP